MKLWVKATLIPRPSFSRSASCPGSTDAAAASRSFSPRPMVERASPVISETASRPPHPVARTSPAANTRRPRSSSFEPTNSRLCQIACVSIMPARIPPQRHPGNPIAPESNHHRAPERNPIHLLRRMSLRSRGRFFRDCGAGCQQHSDTYSRVPAIASARSKRAIDRLRSGPLSSQAKGGAAAVSTKFL